MEEDTWSSWMRPSEVSLILDWDKARKYSLHSDSLPRSTLKGWFTQTMKFQSLLTQHMPVLVLCPENISEYSQQTKEIRTFS